MKRKIVFLDKGTFPPIATFPPLGEEYEWKAYDRTGKDTIVAKLKDANVCVVNKVPLREETLQHLPQLRLIALTATGSDNIDLAYCQANNIAVSNVVAYGTPSISEHVFTMLLAIKRNLLSYREAAFTEWSKGAFFALLHYPITELAGDVLGIMGQGTLGRAVGAVGEAFGMKVLYSERKGATALREGYTAFREVLARADVLSLHLPLTAETENLLGAPELKLMKPTAILINTARGGIVDEEALVAAIKNKQLGGAGIDVTRPEPPQRANPLFALRTFPNVILTPHMAWGGKQALATLCAQVVENIQAFFAGERKRRLV